MAKSGTISLSTDGVLTGKIEWSSTSNGSVANTSTVTARIYARRTDGYTTYGKDWGGYLNIGGTGVSISFSSSVSVGNDWVELASYSKTVDHNPNGTGSVYINGQVSGPVGTSLGGRSVSGGQTVTLDEIPRASTITKIEAQKLDGNVVITLDIKNSSFTHALSWIYNNKEYTSTNFTISNGKITQYINASTFIDAFPTNTDKIDVVFKVTTYSGTKSIGSETATVKLELGDSYYPTLGDVTILDESQALRTTFGKLIVGKSKIVVTPTNPQLKLGATKKAYQYYVRENELKTDTGNSWTSSVIIKAPNNKVKVETTLIDSRDRLSNTVTKELNALQYSEPAITNFQAERQKSAPTKANVKVECSIYSLDQHNSKTAIIYWKNKTSGAESNRNITSNFTLSGEKYVINQTYEITGLTEADQYEFRIELTDYFVTSTNPKTSKYEVGTAFQLMHFGANGNSIAFGKYSEKNNAIEVGDDLKMYYHGKEIESVLEAVDKRANVTNANTTHTYENDKMHLKLLPSTSSMTSNKPNVQSTTADGYIMDFQWDTSGDWRGQLFISGGFRGEATNKNSNQCLQMRFCNNGTWSSWQSVGLTAYPVGAIYISTSSTSPASLFGGSWTQITNRFLYATTTSNTTGGDSTHRHDFKIGHFMNWFDLVGDNYSNQGAWSYSQKKYSKSYGVEGTYSIAVNGGHAQSGGATLNEGIRYSVGDTDTASSMPPYYTVYCWRRTA